MHNLFYASSHKIKGDTITIDTEELHHVRNVLRMKQDDIVWVTDGSGNCYQTKIIELGKIELTAHILKRKHVKRSSMVNLELAFVPLKSSRSDIIIEKGTELSVSKFRFFISKYSVIHQITGQKARRLQRIAVSAMLQSQQYYLPDIIINENVDVLLGSFPEFDLVLVADRQGSLEVPRGAGSVLYIVGPEGGFDDAELEGFQGNGAHLLSLGQNRLRSETAAIVGIAKILSAYGEV